MKVIFLDIDGVLNSARYDCEREYGDGNIDPSRLPLVKSIVDATGAVIVLSTTWRRHWDISPDKRDSIGEELDAVFASAGLSVADKTPWFEKFDRAAEIREWLKQHDGEVESFVILDDVFTGWAELGDRLVRTNFRIGRGLGEEHVQRAIELLGRA